MAKVIDIENKGGLMEVKTALSTTYPVPLHMAMWETYNL
jgi:hypothetical protein